MRRLLAGLAAIALAAIPLSAALPATASVPHPVSPGVVHAGVDDFSFESFTADYYLDTDADGRSTLTTVETFVAVFPDFDQNRGMRRAIPGDYLGAPTDVSIVSVTDENGTPRPFEVETDDEGFVLVTSRAANYVQGRQTYVFTYTQKNVTRYFADTNDDEFFWDTNGTGWYQPFGTVTARVHIPAALAASLTGQSACYRGYEGSTDRCEITSTEEDGGVVLEASVSDLSAFQNVSIAIGFAPGTFVPRDDSYFGSVWGWLQALSVGVGLIALIWGIVLRRTVFADGRGRPTVIAEYTPPKDLDVVTSAILLGRTSRGAAAQFVDLAVTRRIRIIETPATGWFARGTSYLLELIDATGLDGPPLALARALFGYQLAPGTGYQMSSRDSTLSAQVQSVIMMATSSLTQEGYRKRGIAKHGVLPMLAALAATIGSVFFGITMLADSVGGGWPILLWAPPIVGLLIVIGIIGRKPLSDKGAERRDHLRGLELYIRLAEADRLRMLQSPTTAEREAVSTSDPRQVIDIYEKLLPYAVVFGLEKQWAAELARYYVDTTPDWYTGTNAFNAGVFASSIGSLTSSVSTSYSGSSSSSSSGGSGGGGSSGGGGGGGGGGGV